MTKKIFQTVFIVFITIYGIAQTPQFAVVRPDGTTYICPSWDSAYNKAANGDNVYVPGGNFTISSPIDKSLNIFGAGYFIDSSITTSITLINNIILKKGADGGLHIPVKVSHHSGQTEPPDKERILKI